MGENLLKRILVLASSLGTLWLAAASAAPWAEPTASPAPTIYNLRVSNVRDNSFVVSWMTDIPAVGQVNWGPTGGLGNTAEDVRGPGYVGRSHYVVVTGLLPKNTYYFDAVSDSTVDDNEGQHYTLTTAPSDPAPHEPDLAYGRVFRYDDGEPAMGVPVFLAVGDADGTGSPGQSAWMSSLTGDFGYWHLSLSDSRLPDLTDLFDYTPTGGDMLCLVTRDPDGRHAHWVLGTHNRYPAPDLELMTGRQPCDADLVCDGIVYAPDITSMAAAWRQPLDKLEMLNPDVDGNGAMDIVDVQWATSNFGQTCR